MAVVQAPAAIALKNILVATDFSPCSDRALRYALPIARRYGATVHLTHIVDSLGYVLTGRDVLEQAVDLAMREIKHLDSNPIFHAALKDVPHHATVETGDIAQTVCRLAADNDIDLIVIGTHGRSGIRKFFLGSVADQIFRYARCPC